GGVWGLRPQKIRDTPRPRFPRTGVSCVGFSEAHSHQTYQTKYLLEMALTWPVGIPARRTKSHLARAKMIRKLRHAEIDELIAGYVAGATVYELAAKFDVDRKTVSRTLHRHQVPMRMVGLSADQVDEVVTLYEAGWSTGRISERMRVDVRTVHRRLRD